MGAEKHIKFRSDLRKKAVVSGVKRQKAAGKVYVYHKASGIRLPDLPSWNRDFIKAFIAAEIQHRNAIAAANGKLHPMPPPEADLAIPVSPDAIVFRLSQAIMWLHNSQATQVAYYHSGTMSQDLRGNADLDEKRRFFALISSFGLVWLRQKRASENLTHYYAIRTDMVLTGLPRNVLTGTVLPSEYQAMRALLERQSSQSVARCLRDTLDLTETASREMRNDLIKRGWLTNTRGPDFTDLGLSVVA